MFQRTNPHLDFTHVRDDVNLHILLMLEVTFSLDAAQLTFSPTLTVCNNLVPASPGSIGKSEAK